MPPVPPAPLEPEAPAAAPVPAEPLVPLEPPVPPVPPVALLPAVPPVSRPVPPASPAVPPVAPPQSHRVQVPSALHSCAPSHRPAPTQLRVSPCVHTGFDVALKSSDPHPPTAATRAKLANTQVCLIVTSFVSGRRTIHKKEPLHRRAQKRLRAEATAVSPFAIRLAIQPVAHLKEYGRPSHTIHGRIRAWSGAHIPFSVGHHSRPARTGRLCALPV